MVTQTISAAKFKRAWKHVTFRASTLRSFFPSATLDTIEQAVNAGELCHRAQLRIVVEARLTPLELTRGMTARDRAVQLFSELRVWDTQENCGLLLYILVAEGAIELVADRSIHQFAGNESWERVVQQLQAAFSARRYGEGLTEIVTELNVILAKHFPLTGVPALRPNELSNRPLVIV